MRYKYFFLTPIALILFYFCCFGEILSTEAINKSKTPKTFTEEILDLHQHSGCPSNSSCSILTGRLKEQWNLLSSAISKRTYSEGELAKKVESFRKTHGILVNMWSKSEDVNKFPIAIWDSHCVRHRKKKGESIFTAEGLVANTMREEITFFIGSEKKGGEKKTVVSKLKFPLGKDLFFKPVMMVEEYRSIAKKITASIFYLPIDDSPSFVRSGEMVVIKEISDKYYALKISRDGAWIVNKLNSKEGLITDNERKEKVFIKKEVDCPKEQMLFFKKKIDLDGIYSEIYCQEMTDTENKKKYLLLMPSNC